MRDVVVLIPGISGSVLAKDGTDIWALSPGAALRGILSMGRSIDRLRLDGDDPDVDELGDGVVATRLMPDFHLLPGLDWKIDGYRRIARELCDRFGCVPGLNYFELPYDWRRDNRVAARALARKAHGWLRSWRETSGDDQAKLVLVGHSMGGIVARLYLEFHEGWKDTRTLITFGTPYSGSVNALDFLANGFRKGWGPFTVDLGATLRSFTSVYQLLPSYRCLEGPAGRWLNLDEVDWSGTAIDTARVAQAVGLHRDLRAAVDARRAGGDEAYDVRPVIGDFQRTLWAARRVGTGVETMASRRTGESEGDGTVPKVSAIPHEYLPAYTNAAFVGQKHASLQNDDPVIDHVGGILRLAPAEPVDVFPARESDVALEVADVTTTEPLVIRARPASPDVVVTAVLRPIDGVADTRSLPLTRASDTWHTAAVEGMPPGDYRVTVAGAGLHPVTDVVSVVQLDDVTRAAEAASEGT